MAQQETTTRIDLVTRISIIPSARPTFRRSPCGEYTTVFMQIDDGADTTANAREIAIQGEQERERKEEKVHREGRWNATEIELHKYT